MTSKSAAFIYGYYGAGNFGDDLLALSTVEGLSHRNFADSFYLRNYGDVVTMSRCSAISVTTDFEPLLLGRRGFWSKFAGLWRYLLVHWRLFARCKAFVMGGGTLIGGHLSTKTMLIQSALIGLAKLRGLRVFAIGLGVAAIKHPVNRQLARFVLRRCDRVCLRDERSFVIAKELSGRNNCSLTGDLVYGLPDERFGMEPNSRGPVSKTIGISLAGPFLGSRENQDVMRVVSNALGGAISRWQAEGFRVRFISFQDAGTDSGLAMSDTTVLQQLARGLDLDELDLFALTAHPASIDKAFQGLEVLVGMRFHGMVVAALRGIPFVGFSYDDKVSELCRAYALPCRSVEHISTEWLLDAREQAKRRGIDAHINERFRAIAELNFDLAK